IMLKRILSFRALNNTSFLTTSTPSLYKVIFRALSQADFEVVKKWDLFSAVCLERHPVITKPMEDIEARYHEMLQQREFENSLISDFEIQLKQELSRKEKTISTDENVDEIVTQTLQDFEDSSKQELMKFKFAPRTGEDTDDGTPMLKRKLDKTLVLLVTQQVGCDNFWIPPQNIRKHRETMIQTAQRTVQELCGNNIKVKFYSSAPIGFYQYKYPKDVRLKGQDGAKIFYFLAKYISGDISSDIKHCWLDREELKKTVHPNLYGSLSQFLLPE
ncbi:39S ribosomal protein L46, mitochondrial, partial [Dufourea novaeangliae]